MNGAKKNKLIMNNTLTLFFFLFLFVCCVFSKFDEYLLLYLYLSSSNTFILTELFLFLIKKNKLSIQFRFSFEINDEKNDFCNMSQMINRPPIKNNLNEQLKIYYAYRDETRQNHLNNIENRSLSQ